MSAVIWMLSPEPSIFAFLTGSETFAPVDVSVTVTILLSSSLSSFSAVLAVKVIDACRKSLKTGMPVEL